MESVGRTYAEMAEELVQEMRELLQGRGPLGRVHLLKVTAADAAAAAVGLMLAVFFFIVLIFVVCLVLILFSCTQPNRIGAATVSALALHHC